MVEEPKPTVGAAASWIRLLIVLMLTAGLTTGLLYGAAKDTPPHQSDGLSVAAVLWIVAMIAYGINWLVFIPANMAQTEKYYDFTGSITYFSTTVVSLVLGASHADWTFSVRAIVQSVMVLVWCIRLGSFLFTRIKKDGKDGRFDDIKITPPRFFAAWTIQGVWVLLTALPVFTVNAMSSTKDLGVNDYIGWAIWVFGFALEVISDNQKGAFAANPANKGQFINEGLWYYSRHPNYFGEMTLWLGQFVAATSVISGSQYCLVISPLFVVFLLCKISGLPMLEARSDEKFKGNAEYELFKANTSILIPWFKGSKTEKDAAMLLQPEGAANTVYAIY